MDELLADVGCARVCPGVLLGGHQAGSSRRLHQDLGVTLVVNCTKDMPWVQEQDAGTTYVRLEVDDDGRDYAHETRVLAQLMPDAVARIHDAVTRGGCALVHCQMGRQRSAAVVAGYLMWRDGLSPAEAVSRVRQAKRDTFFPFVNFQATLDQYGVLLCRSDAKKSIK